MAATLFQNRNGRRQLKIRDFAVLVTRLEGKKKQVNIAQVMEILRVINKLMGGVFYRLIRCGGVKDQAKI
jgi:hypothetical protein